MTRADRLALYTRAAELCFGPRWQSEAARHHGVAIRTVQRWVALELDIPAGVFVEIADLLAARRGLIDEVAAEIAALVGPGAPSAN